MSVRSRLIATAMRVSPLALLLAFAPTASAALPRGGADFGGGSIKLALTYGNPEYVGIHTARSGHTLRFRALLEPLDCSGEVTIAPKDIQVGTDGSFHATGGIYSTAPPYQHIGTYQFQGRFTDRSHASGTERAQFTKSANGQTEMCDTSVVKWRVASPRAHSGAGKLHGAASYYGHTSQPARRGGTKLGFLMKTTRKGKSLKVAAAETENTCPGHAQFDGIVSGGFLVSFVPIKNGAFGGHAPLTVTRHVDGQKYRVHFKLSLRGKFGRHEVKGTWRTDADVYRKSDGAHVAHCPGAKLSWVAAR